MILLKVHRLQVVWFLLCSAVVKGFSLVLIKFDLNTFWTITMTSLIENYVKRRLLIQSVLSSAKSSVW